MSVTRKVEIDTETYKLIKGEYDLAVRYGKEQFVLPDGRNFSTCYAKFLLDYMRDVLRSRGITLD